MKTEEERFWRRVKKDGPIPVHRPELGPCWVWTGATNQRGYGRFKTEHSKLVCSHHYSLRKTGANIEEGKLVCHHCDNPSCVRPDHLFQGTHSDNMADMVRKKRHVFGDHHPARLHPENMRRGDNHPARLHPEKMARGDMNGARLHPERLKRGIEVHCVELNEDKVRAIREEYASGGYRLIDLGHKYGVHLGTIWQVVNRHTWTHVA